MYYPTPSFSVGPQLRLLTPKHGALVPQKTARRADLGRDVGLTGAPANLTVAPSSTRAYRKKRSFRLIALSQIKVVHGVMQGDVLNGIQDLVLGDSYLFDAASDVAPVDSRLIEGKLHLTLSGQKGARPRSMAVRAQREVAMMTHDATVMRCKYYRCRTVDSAEEEFLLIPADVKTNKVYELISLAG